MNAKQLTMRPQDVVILLKKVSPAGWKMSGKQLSESLGISQSEVSESLERSRVSGLLNPSKSKVNTLALKDFLIYGLRYAFPVIPAGIVRGIPTGVSASPIREKIVNGEESFVWPYQEGNSRGQAIQPLYPTVPMAAEHDADLYALMAAVETLRFGRVREKDVAVEILESYFLNYAKQL